MKKVIITLTIVLIAISSLFADAHFRPEWVYDIPQNPYMAMNIYAYGQA